MKEEPKPIINAWQHLFCNAARGYVPQYGRGFQTVAVSPELCGTDDLRALEDAAFYAVSYERRSTGGALPVKETFFRLPSGRFAIGRTVDWGTDQDGRPGNYLTHHLIFSREDWLAAGVEPFAVLDAARLAAPDTDVTPRDLPALARAVAPVSCDAGPDGELLAQLAARVVDGAAQTALLVGDEARSKTILRRLYAALAREERLRLTFSTHFYESHHLRSLFALASVSSWAEAPSQRQDYAIFDLDTGAFPAIEPASAYSVWLAECLSSGHWQEINALNAALDGLRNGQDRNAWPVKARACAALWERAGVKIARVLAGQPQWLSEFLRHLPAPRPLADAVLEVATPETLAACLPALHAHATRKVWRKWAQQWQDDPALAAFLQSVRPWWQKWRTWKG